MGPVDHKLIVRQVLEGDRESYRLIVERYHGGLIRYCHAITQDEASAHDAAQQAFINAYQHLAQYKDKYAFSTWLYRIARNCALAEVKKLNKHTEFEDEMLHDTNDIDDRLDREAAVHTLRRAMSGLRTEFREVIHFYYWEGKSYEEVAEAMDKPLNTIKVWIKRAKQQLAKEVGETI